jgi:hypothetical protein
MIDFLEEEEEDDAADDDVVVVIVVDMALPPTTIQGNITLVILRVCQCICEVPPYPEERANVTMECRSAAIKYE